MDPQKLIVIDATSQPWEERFNGPTGKVLFRKELFTDLGTGMEVRLVRYPAGFVNPLHTHHCAHGMYVLEGTLVTHEGQYGPGHFVWFPEGNVMEHGATAEQDVTVLFVTNKAFDIHYQEEIASLTWRMRRASWPLADSRPLRSSFHQSCTMRGHLPGAARS